MLHSDPSFPNSSSYPFILTSPPTPNYNCIAWAYEINHKRMWPKTRNYWWPNGVLNEVSLNAFIDLFEKIGYQACDNESFEVGFLKIAIYDKDGVPTHAARQLSNGMWTSKLGDAHDISHSLEGMANGFYGNAVHFMKRHTL